MRPPEVFVRELSPEEGARLKSISKRARYQSKRQRAMILLASASGMSAPQIARVVRTDESHVRKVIHAFNERGFASLDPDYRGGRPRKTTPEERDRIVSVARARPDTQGVALAETAAAWIKDRVSEDAGKIDGSARYWFDGWINTLLLAYMSAGTVRLSASEMLEIFVHWFPDIGRNDRGDGR